MAEPINVHPKFTRILYKSSLSRWLQWGNMPCHGSNKSQGGYKPERNELFASSQVATVSSHVLPIKPEGPPCHLKWPSPEISVL